jgi:predicted RNA binding protein YcfA (HicA-like mRNA interferase family)
MRIPRDMTGEQLVKRLERFGYARTRQTGSHIRLTTERGGRHHVTVPAHNPIRLGTLNAVLVDVAEHLGISKDDVLREILG